MDSALYTKPYALAADGVVALPPHVTWLVLPQYHGQRADGTPVVDHRITVVLQDAPNRFWPLVVKMSPAEAEQLKDALSRVLAEKRGGGRMNEDRR